MIPISPNNNYLFVGNLYIYVANHLSAHNCVLHRQLLNKVSSFFDGGCCLCCPSCSNYGRKLPHAARRSDYNFVHNARRHVYRSNPTNHEQHTLNDGDNLPLYTLFYNVLHPHDLAIPKLRVVGHYSQYAHNRLSYTFLTDDDELRYSNRSIHSMLPKYALGLAVCHIRL
jgi:hypothetical protein